MFLMELGRMFITIKTISIFMYDIDFMKWMHQVLLLKDISGSVHQLKDSLYGFYYYNPCA